MFRRPVTVIALCVLAFSAVAAQTQGPSEQAASTSIEPSSIKQLQLATMDKYSGKAVASEIVRPTAAKRRSGYQTLREEYSNSFVIGGGYNFQRVDDMPVDRVQGVFATGFYYPVSWVGFGGEYQYGRGSQDGNRLTRHVGVIGPEFSGFPGDRVRIFFHPLAGWAKERLTTRIGSTTVTTEGTNLAVQLGGGLDVRLNRTFSWRAFQLDYLGIRRNDTWQNNWRLVTGLAVRPR